MFDIPTNFEGPSTSASLNSSLIKIGPVKSECQNLHDLSTLLFLNTLNQIRIMSSWKGKCCFNGCIMSLWRLITICTPYTLDHCTLDTFLDHFQPTHSPYHLYLNQSLGFFQSVRKKKNKKNFSKKWKIKKPRNKSIPDLIQFIITCHTFQVSFEHF